MRTITSKSLPEWAKADASADTSSGRSSGHDASTKDASEKECIAWLAQEVREAHTELRLYRIEGELAELKQLIRAVEPHVGPVEKGKVHKFEPELCKVEHRIAAIEQKLTEGKLEPPEAPPMNTAVGRLGTP